MGLKAAICTQCGAQIEVDDTKDAGICRFCGTAFVTEKVIQQYSFNISNATFSIAGANVENLLRMANNAVEAKNYVEAVGYYNKVLEIDPTNTDALYSKGYCSFLNIRNCAELNATELKTYVVKALNGCNDKNYIYNALYRLNPLAVLAVDSVNSYYNQGDNRKRQESIEILRNGHAVAHDITSYIISQIEVRNYTNDPMFKELYITCLKNDMAYLAEWSKHRQYVRSVTQNDGRMIENMAYLPLDKDVHTNIILTFDNVKRKYTEMTGMTDTPFLNRNTNVPACYVATCVYESYDCPQVWTLRRYRDFELAKTWHGRAFIKTYYTISPTIVRIFGNQRWFRKLWKSKLDRMVTKLNQKGFENTAYEDKVW